MSLKEILSALRRRWVFLVLPLLLFLGLSVVVNLAAPRIYTAATTSFYSLASTRNLSDANQGVNYVQLKMSSYAQLATSALVLNPVAAELANGYTPEALKRKVQASYSPESVILEITASDTDPNLAARIANAVVQQLNVQVADLEPKDEQGRPILNSKVVSPATPPATPSSPNEALNLLAGALAGLLVGFTLALLLEKLDNRVREASHFPEGYALLAPVPHDRRSRSPVLDPDNPGARAEAYRRLRTNLRLADVDSPPRVLAITSSLAQEGKTTTALNLAVVYAEAGDRVLLIDADLRRPAIASSLGLDGSVGLIDVLAGDLTLAEVVRPWAPGVDLLLSGGQAPNPSIMLGSKALRRLIETATAEYDVVIFDTPPMLPVTDAAVLGSQVEAVLMVARYGATTRQNLAVSLAGMEKVGAQVVGVVLNRVPGQVRSYGNTAEVRNPRADVTEKVVLAPARPRPKTPTSAQAGPAPHPPQPSSVRETDAALFTGSAALAVRSSRGGEAKEFELRRVEPRSESVPVAPTEKAASKPATTSPEREGPAIFPVATVASDQKTEPQPGSGNGKVPPGPLPPAAKDRRVVAPPLPGPLPPAAKDQRVAQPSPGREPPGGPGRSDRAAKPVSGNPGGLQNANGAKPPTTGPSMVKPGTARPDQVVPAQPPVPPAPANSPAPRPQPEAAVSTADADSDDHPLSEESFAQSTRLAQTPRRKPR